jgi:lipoprotein-releasing system ATP-binding protein
MSVKATGLADQATSVHHARFMLEVRSIAKRFPSPAGELTVLRDVTMSLDVGDSVAIMGPSGCGKSTLLSILGTLEPPSSGTMRLDDCDPFALSASEAARFRNRCIGFVFQDHHLLPQCSVLENVLLPTLATKDGGAGSVERARDLLDRVGLSDRVEHLPGELSGGERQRAAVARSLINKPRLCLADEPTGNLDRETADAVGATLADLHRAEGSILIVVTHSERLAGSFDRILDLDAGELVPR